MEDQKGDMKSDEVVGYVHNVSPVKSGCRFDFQLQTQEKNVRGECFSPSYHKRFQEMSKISSPVKLKKFRLDTKSNSEDILMVNDVSVEECSADFEKIEMPTTLNLGNVKSVCLGQPVTVKAKVVSLHAQKHIRTKNLYLQEATLVDPHGTMKMVLWSEFIGTVKEGETYIFQDVKVKRDAITHDIFLNTAKSGTKITDATPFTEVSAIAAEMPVDFYNTTVLGEVLGIENIGFYLSCRKCGKKVDSAAAANVVECTSCHLRQKKNSCTSNWYVNILFEKASGDKLKLVMFQDAIEKAYNIAKTPFEKDNITKEHLEDVILFLPTDISVTYRRKDKVITEINKIAADEMIVSDLKEDTESTADC